MMRRLSAYYHILILQFYVLLTSFLLMHQHYYFLVQFRKLAEETSKEGSPNYLESRQIGRFGGR